MGLHRFKPMPSGRMGIFWTIAPISEAAVVEFGCMGHNLYSGGSLKSYGIYEGYGAPLYTTYIDETDIAMGDTSRLDATLAGVIASDKPKVVFLQPSAVPEVVGMDMYAIAKLLQDNYPDTPLIPLGHGSFAISQHKGVEEALTVLAQTLPEAREKTPEPTFNIIGSCPDLFNFGADALEIRRLMKEAFGMEKICVFSSDCSVTDIRNMGGAHINLVFRREGIPAAKVLEEKFGTPWIFGRPYGMKATTAWLRSVGEVLGRAPDEEFIKKETDMFELMADRPRRTLQNNQWSYPNEAVLTIGGHYDVVKGIRDYALGEMHLNRGPCWCDCPEMGDEDIPYYSEKEWIPIVSAHDKGYLMFSGEALRWAGKNLSLQIANPDVGQRIHPWGAPFVGYRGAVNLMNLWINEYTLKH